MRTRSRKRALDDDSHVRRADDHGNMDSYRPERPSQSSSKHQSRADDEQKEHVRHMTKKPATVQSNRNTSRVIDLTGDDDDDVVYLSKRTLPVKKPNQFDLPYRPTPGYKPHVESNAVEDRNGKIKRSGPKLGQLQKETFARWMESSKILGRHEGSLHKKRGSLNEGSYNKKRSWMEKSGSGIMFTVPEAIAALEEAPKTVPYTLPTGQYLSYPVIRSSFGCHAIRRRRYSLKATTFPSERYRIAKRPAQDHSSSGLVSLSKEPTGFL